MGTAGSVCAQPPAAQGLLDQFLASVRFFGGPGFWQVSDKVNPGSVNPGNGELQNWNSKFIPKRTAIHTKTLPETPPCFLTALRPQGESWGQGGPLLPARRADPSSPADPLQHPSSFLTTAQPPWALLGPGWPCCPPQPGFHAWHSYWLCQQLSPGNEPTGEQEEVAAPFPVPPRHGSHG